MNFILFLYIIIYSVLYDQPNHAPSTKHHTSRCMFLLPALASAVCFLQRVHVEKWSGKRFPEPQKCGVQRCGCNHGVGRF